jgi:glycosyltransferase involved in cell wall biosynthesis
MVLDEHNIEYELLYRLFRKERSIVRKLYNGVEYVKVKRSERSTWSRVDACLVTSEREEHTVRRHAPRTRTRVVPNGVDLEVFQPQETPTDPHSLVFVGTMNYRPNADAVIYLAGEILPEIWKTRPDVTLTVVGQEPPEEVRRLAGPRIAITGWVDDVRPYVRRAAVVVTPVRIGSGTRLKVLEAFAMGKAVVSTPLGCEGIAVKDGEHLLVADNPADLAARVVRLLDDPALAIRLGMQGRALVERTYGWRAVVDDLDALHSELLETRGREDTVAVSA